MAFEGKKYKKVDFSNIVEILDALKLDDKTKGLLSQPDAVTSISKNADGSITYKAEVGDKVLLNDTYPLNKEIDYKTPDGNEHKLKVWFEGDVLKQTLTTKSGKVITLERTFSGDKMTLTVSLAGLDTKGTVEYLAV